MLCFLFWPANSTFCYVFFYTPWWMLVCAGTKTRNRANNIPRSIPFSYLGIISKWNQLTKIGMQCWTYCWWIWWEALGGAGLHSCKSSQFSFYLILGILDNQKGVFNPYLKLNFVLHPEILYLLTQYFCKCTWIVGTFFF